MGTGKTHGAVTAGYCLLGQGKLVYFSTVIRRLDSLRPAFRSKCQEGHYKLVDKLCKVDVVILDDFGKQRDTDFAQERIANIIDQRHSAKLITIVTTNLNLDELGAWDSSTASRMFDRSMAVAVPTFGLDYRRKGVSCGCVLDRPPSAPTIRP